MSDKSARSDESDKSERAEWQTPNDTDTNQDTKHLNNIKLSLLFCYIPNLPYLCDNKTLNLYFS